MVCYDSTATRYPLTKIQQDTGLLNIKSEYIGHPACSRGLKLGDL